VRATFRSLGNRNYRMYFIGQTVSLTGTWMQRVGQGWLVLELTDSAAMLGLTAALQALPLLLTGVWGGLLADRMDKRRLLLCTQALSAILAAVLAILIVTQLVQLWMVLLLAFSLGIVNALDNPARHGFISEMVTRDDLANAVTLNSIAVNIGRSVGPALAGLLIAAAGLAAAFAVNAFSFLAVFLALLFMRLGEIDRPIPAPRAPGQIREGLRYASSQPEVAAPLLILAITGLLAAELQVKLPILAVDAFGGGAQTYGFMLSAIGVGAVVGGLVVAGSLQPSQKTLLLTTVGFGVVLLVVSVAPTLPVAYAAMFVLGASSIAYRSAAMSLLQLAAAPALRGRVLSLAALAQRGTTPLAAPLAGWLAEVVSARFSLGLGGVASIFAAVAVALYLRRRAPDPPDPGIPGTLPTENGKVVRGQASNDVTSE
jgi:MFS family permease